MTFSEDKKLFDELREEAKKKGYKDEEARQLAYRTFAKLYSQKKIGIIDLQYAIDLSGIVPPLNIQQELDEKRSRIRKIYALDKMEEVVLEDVKEKKYAPIALFPLLVDSYRDGTYSFNQLEQMAFALNIELNNEFLELPEEKKKTAELLFHPRPSYPDTNKKN